MSEKKKKSTDKAPAKKASEEKSSKGDIPAAAAAETPSNYDFEAGILFSRFDSSRSGVLSADDFRKMWYETKAAKVRAASTPVSMSVPSSGIVTASSPVTPSPFDMSSLAFEAGQIFTTFDKDADGKLNRSEFESLIKTHTDLVKFAMTPAPVNPQPDTSLPLEIVTGRVLTHFDETAGIAISSDEIEQHRNLGHSVVPLVDAYKLRYDRLRALLATKVLPKREYLLQLRRQLQNTSTEVEAVRKGIEKETLTDTERIIERLRAAESLRQAAIQKQMNVVDNEIDSMEHIIRRVDQAHEDNVKSSLGQSGIVVTSFASGASGVDHQNHEIRGPRGHFMVELINQFKEICMKIEQISNKTFQIQTEFSTDDFPYEIRERWDLIERSERFSHAIQVKDQMLYTSLSDQGKLEDALQEEKRLSAEYAQEVAHWADIANHLNQELSAVKSEQDSLNKRHREMLEVLRRHNLLPNQR